MKKKKKRRRRLNRHRLGLLLSSMSSAGERQLGVFSSCLPRPCSRPSHFMSHYVFVLWRSLSSVFLLLVVLRCFSTFLTLVCDKRDEWSYSRG